jgi:hypothetical protein
MRRGVTEAFDETLNWLLSTILVTMLGPSVRNEAYALLTRRGIDKNEVPTRFDDVVNLLGEAFGTVGAKVIIYQVIAELHREYSQPINFSFQGMLRDKMLWLRERVVLGRIWPIHMQDGDSFFDKGSQLDQNLSPNDSADPGLTGLYHYKRGVGSNSNPNW